MKETFYFSHDYNASQDPKILNMMSELGIEGYGLFWLLIEKLAEANGKLLLNDLKGLAFAWKIDCSKLDLLSSKFNLFTIEGEYFYSNRLLEHLKHRNNLSKVRAKMGRIGGLAKAKQMLSNSQANAKQNVAKERKGKESKVKEINALQATPANTEIPLLIKEFEELNPTINYGNKTQRKACEELIEKFGYEKVVNTLNYYKSIRHEKFSPTITTPYQLQQKMGELINFYNKEKNNSKFTTI